MRGNVSKLGPPPHGPADQQDSGRLPSSLNNSLRSSRPCRLPEIRSGAPRAPATFPSTFRTDPRPAVSSLPTLPPPHSSSVPLTTPAPPPPGHHHAAPRPSHKKAKSGAVTRTDSHTPSDWLREGAVGWRGDLPAHIAREDRWWAAGGAARRQRRRWGAGAWWSWPWPPRSGSPAPPSTGATRRASPPPRPPRRWRPPPPRALPAAATARRPFPLSPSPQVSCPVQSLLPDLDTVLASSVSARMLPIIR